MAISTILDEVFEDCPKDIPEFDEVLYLNFVSMESNLLLEDKYYCRKATQRKRLLEIAVKTICAIEHLDTELET